MYNNYNSNRPLDGLNVNTQYFQDFSDTGKIVVSGWNDKVSIRFTRASGVNADGLTMYNDQDYLATALTKDAVKALIDGIDNTIIPAVKAGDMNTSVAIQTASNENGSTVIEILVASNSKDQLAVFLNGHKYVSNGPVDTYVHEFRQKSYLKDFNPMTNEGARVDVQTKFMQFVDILRKSLDPIAVTVHGEKYRAKMAEAYNSNRGGNNSNYGNRGGYQNNNAQSQSTSDYVPSYDPSIGDGLPFSN